MKLSRIDQIALNGATGEHYKYEEIADKLWTVAHPPHFPAVEHSDFIQQVVRILVEAFPND